MHILKQSCYMWPTAIWGLSFPHWAEKKKEKALKKKKLSANLKHSKTF